MYVRYMVPKSIIPLIGLLGFFVIGPWYSYLSYSTALIDFPIGYALFQVTSIITLFFFLKEMRMSNAIIIIILILLTVILTSELWKATNGVNSGTINIIVRNLQIFLLAYALFNFKISETKLEKKYVVFSLIFVFVTILLSWRGLGVDWVGRNKSNTPAKTTLAYAPVMALLFFAYLNDSRQRHGTILHFMFFLITSFTAFAVGSRQILLFSFVSYLFIFGRKSWVFILVFGGLVYWLLKRTTLSSRFRIEEILNSVSFNYRWESVANFRLDSVSDLWFGPGSSIKVKSIEHLSPHGILGYFDNFGIFTFLIIMTLLLMTIKKLALYSNDFFSYPATILLLCSFFTATYANYFIMPLFAFLVTKLRVERA